MSVFPPPDAVPFDAPGDVAVPPPAATQQPPPAPVLGERAAPEENARGGPATPEESARAGRARRPGRLRLADVAKRPLAVLPALLLIAALFGAWELYIDLEDISPLLLPAPHAIAVSLYDDRGLLWSNFLTTAAEVLLGLAAAIVSGFALATLIHLSATLRRACYPLLVASQTLPVPIFAPVLVLWLGFGIAPKLVVIAVVSFFPVVVTTLAGFEAVDHELITLMRTFDATRMRTFRMVELPAALPGLFTGAKLAAVFAVIGAVFAEWAGASSGLGYLFNVSLSQSLMARAFACAAVLSAFAIALFALLTVAERLALPWAHKQTGEGR